MSVGLDVTDEPVCISVSDKIGATMVNIDEANILEIKAMITLPLKSSLMLVV